MTKNAGAVGLQAVAVFPPWFSEQQSFTSVAITGAPIAAPGPVDWMVIAIPQSDQQSHDLQSSNALFLLNAEFARLCGAGQHATRSPEVLSAE
ncbi:hypothetical protein [Roseibium sp. LAB1]